MCSPLKRVTCFSSGSGDDARRDRSRSAICTRLPKFARGWTVSTEAWMVFRPSETIFWSPECTLDGGRLPRAFCNVKRCWAEACSRLFRIFSHLRGQKLKIWAKCYRSWFYRCKTYKNIVKIDELLQGCTKLRVIIRFFCYSVEVNGEIKRRGILPHLWGGYVFL